MRFDDSLDTVLAAETATPFGATSAWRQLVDLVGRGRGGSGTDAIARIAELRGQVPSEVRAASARALALADPPATLVRLFAQDNAAIAAPVLRTARLTDAEWISLLEELTPSTRAILRNRRDLSPNVVRALASFGSTDLILGNPEQEDGVVPVAATPVDAVPGAAGTPVIEQPDSPGFEKIEIADLVARIAAFQRAPRPIGVAAAAPPASSFRFETDEMGTLRWVDGVSRAPLIGLSLDSMAAGGESRVDGIVLGAFRRRAAFNDARLLVGGNSDVTGQWRISAVPVFDDASGRFTGYRGTARRPRADEHAEPLPVLVLTPPAESLRQLVHELRTPTNAIAGFAEMIEREMLGPVGEAYRSRAADIQHQAETLLAAIEDIDIAARIESKALDLRPGRVALAPLLTRVSADLMPLAALRGVVLVDAASAADLHVAADDRALERLFARLLATLVSISAAGERIGVTGWSEPDEQTVAISIDRPAALADYPGDAVLAIDRETTDDAAATPLLGVGFTLRLVRNLAVEMGGVLTIGDKALTLRLPAVETIAVGKKL